mgnify:CR=1 FL=1
MYFSFGIKFYFFFCKANKVFLKTCFENYFLKNKT